MLLAIPSISWYSSVSPGERRDKPRPPPSNYFILDVNDYLLRYINTAVETASSYKLELNHKALNKVAMPRAWTGALLQHPVFGLVCAHTCGAEESICNDGTWTEWFSNEAGYITNGHKGFLWFWFVSFINLLHSSQFCITEKLNLMHQCLSCIYTGANYCGVDVPPKSTYHQ